MRATDILFQMSFCENHFNYFCLLDGSWIKAIGTC